jgi:hypothetical protein
LSKLCLPLQLLSLLPHQSLTRLQSLRKNLLLSMSFLPLCPPQPPQPLPWAKRWQRQTPAPLRREHMFLMRCLSLLPRSMRWCSHISKPSLLSKLKRRLNASQRLSPLLSLVPLNKRMQCPSATQMLHLCLVTLRAPILQKMLPL